MFLGVCESGLVTCSLPVSLCVPLSLLLHPLAPIYWLLLWAIGLVILSLIHV